jgi:protein-L-isoaspartate(D-aspartate) O-methyltransferase
MTLTLDHTAARRAMIDSQLRVSGISDERVLAAMNAVPREDFVPAAARNHAYIDRAIPLGGGRFLAAPLVQGMTLAEAGLRSDDKLLVVSGGCGYLAALAGRLAGAVETIDAASAAAVKRGSAGFTVLLVDGAIEQLPAGLAGELAEGGRIVTGLVERGVTRLAAGRKLGGAVSLVPLAEIGIPVLAEFAAPKGWSF